MALGALLTQHNGGRHDILGGHERTPEEIQAWRASLAAWWDIETRADLITSLNWIEKRGHREDFDEFATYIETASSEDIADLRREFQGDPEALNQLELALEYHESFGDKSILAWDYGRYVSLCGWGYVVGFLTEDEALRKMMPVARQMQTTFESWEDFGQNYLVGREFWSLAQTRTNGNRMRQSYLTLLSNPESPWVKLAWNLNLEPPETP